MKQYAAQLKTEASIRPSAAATIVTPSDTGIEESLTDGETTDTEDPSSASLQKLYLEIDALMQKEKLFLRTDLTRDYLTKRMGTNKNRLTASVQAGTGMAVSDYINEYRLREGLLLLEENPDTPLSEIADQTGFGTYSSFYRAFLKRFGVKPAEYRKFLNTKK